MKKMKGYVQVYTGSGKGKTTAALGLTLRAAGAGLKVFIGQFLKTGTYSEIKGLALLGDAVRVEQFGGKRFIKAEPTEKDRELAKQGLKRMKEVLAAGEYDIVILEEINVALKLGLASVEQVLDLIRSKPESTEIILTGRYAPAEIIEAADLVTEMTCLKHYIDQGVSARVGIEK